MYAYTDTDGDGKADKKEFFTDNFGRAGNVEHHQAFLLGNGTTGFTARLTPSASAGL
ncbi:MAG: hypothetical protein R3B93_24410 [Bacteroidia bacterium]